MNVQNPAQPRLETSLFTGCSFAARGIYVQKEQLYVAGGERGLSILNWEFRPSLRISPAAGPGGKVSLTWESRPGLKLQRASALSSADWSEVPGTEGGNTLEIPADEATGFFRLYQP